MLQSHGSDPSHPTKFIIQPFIWSKEKLNITLAQLKHKIKRYDQKELSWLKTWGNQKESAIVNFTIIKSVWIEHFERLK